MDTPLTRTPGTRRFLLHRAALAALVLGVVTGAGAAIRAIDGEPRANWLMAPAMVLLCTGYALFRARDRAVRAEAAALAAPAPAPDPAATVIWPHRIRRAILQAVLYGPASIAPLVLAHPDAARPALRSGLGGALILCWWIAVLVLLQLRRPSRRRRPTVTLDATGVTVREWKLTVPWSEVRGVTIDARQCALRWDVDPSAVAVASGLAGRELRDLVARVGRDHGISVDLPAAPEVAIRVTHAYTATDAPVRA